MSCDHKSTEYLGSMGNTLFHECECGDVLVSQDGRTWVLPGTPVAERRTATMEFATAALDRATGSPMNSGVLRGITAAARRLALGMIGRRARTPDSGR